MNRLENILLRVRDTLADPYKQKWTDERLLRLINDAQLDIVREAHLLKKKALVPLQEGSNIIQMPDDFYLLLRVIYKDCELQIKNVYEFEKECRQKPAICSSELVENMNEHWEKHIGCEPKYLVFDLANPKEVRIYPIPNCLNGQAKYVFISCPVMEGTHEAIIDDFGALGYFEGFYEGLNAEIDDYGVTGEVMQTDLFDNATLNNDFGVVWSMPLQDKRVSMGYYGVVCDIECFNTENIYGVVSDVGYNGELIDLYGVLVGLEIVADTLEVHYIKKPKPIENLESELEIPDIWDTAIKYYVCAMAFRDDKDTQHRQMGAEEWQLYQRELRRIKKDSARDFTARDWYFKTNYHTVFDE